MHEAKMHTSNSFVTLTYSDEHLPHRGQLVYDHYQRFMKRLRKQTGPNRVRFYMGGEYGETTWRPHFHACLFGIDWDDKLLHKTNAQGDKIYTSARLEQLWGMGFCTTGAVTFESAAYIARYCCSKRTGKEAEHWYKRVDADGEYQLTPEFNRMSLKPGIGANWLHKYKDDVYNYDHVIVRGKETTPPKYYDTLLKRIDADKMDAIKTQRELDGYQRRDDNTPERLAVKEQVTRAAIKQLQRNL